MSKKKNTKDKGVNANTHYKDTVFRMLFKDKKRLLGLYNAVSGKHYTNPEELEIVTLESSTYMGMKNDLAFVVDFGLYLFEHQSTINYNMPLRFLLYISSEYGKLVGRRKLYEEKLTKIATPHFMVFYNGTKTCAECRELKLSDAFLVREETPELELRVQVLNINKGFNEDLKEQCKTLGEYMQYVDKVRNYAKEMSINHAVDRAVDECIEQDVLREFLQKEKAEVKHMSLLEYDAELALEIAKESAAERGFEEGTAKGLAEGTAKGLAEGTAKGLAKGLAEGTAKGLAKGLAEGLMKGKSDMLVKNINSAMRNFHIDLSEACRGLGVTVEEYEKAKELLENEKE